MRRVALGCVLLALVAVGVRVVDAQAAVTARGPGREPAREAVDRRPPTSVAMYGDSLADQARTAFTARMRQRAPGALTVSTFPGTAPCDYRAGIVTGMVVHRPQVVVLEFSGNSLTDCMRSDRGAFLRIGSNEWRNRYLEDLRAIVNVANLTRTTIVWGTAPPVDNASRPQDYPRLLATAVRALAANEPRLEVADTGAALTSDDHSYRSRLPCRPDEQAFCTDRQIEVRSDDRLHFDCHGAPAEGTACPGYSAGGRRYGEALADAAIAAG